MKTINDFLKKLDTVHAIHIIVFLGLIIFANALFNKFVWDDHLYIIQNPQTNSFDFFSFFGPNVFNNAGQYRPLTIAYFAFLRTTFGDMQFFYHSIQLLLHIINTSLLFILFKQFFNKPLSLFLSLVFLIHPMQVESVSYIAASASVLFFLCGITAFLIGKNYPKKLWKEIILYILLLIAILIKETGILFLFIFLLYKIFFEKKYLLRATLFGVGIICIYFFIRTAFGQVGFETRALIPIARLDFFERLLTMPQVIFYYIKTFFYPDTLSIVQHWVVTTPDFPNFYFPLLVDIIFFTAIFGFAIFLFKKRNKLFKPFIFFTLWFLLGMGLHSQIFPLDMTVADRWFYFDMVGILGMLGIIFSQINIFRNEKIKPVLIFSALLILLLLSTRTVARNTDWQTPEKLFSHDTKIQDNYLIYAEYSLELFYEGKFQEALIPAKKSVALFPNELNIHNLAYIYEKLGDTETAKTTYKKALHAPYYSPDNHKHYASTYTRHATLLLRDDPEEARKLLLDAVKDHPDAPRLWLLLSLAEYKLQNPKAAFDAASSAHTLSPNDPTINQVYNLLLANKSIEIAF